MRRAAFLVLVVLLAPGLALVPGPSSARPARARYIVVLRAGEAPARVAQDHARRFGARPTMVYRHALRGYAASLPGDQVTALEADPRVSYVVRDSSYSIEGSRPTPTQLVPSGVRRIGADVSSTRAGDGRGAVPVNVAVLDTGIDPAHPDLDVVGGAACNGRTYADQNGHGTHVAGTIGARDNGIGVVGVAPGARLWAVRVLDAKGSGNKSNLLCGLDFVTGTRTDADPTNDIAVANMSLGQAGSDDGNCGLTKKDPVHAAICAASSAGVTFVVAAGNSPTDIADHEPAGWDEVLTVTAMADFDGQPGALAAGDETCAESIGTTLADFPFYDDAITRFSAYATLPADRAHTVAAPGMCVTSTLPGGTYGLETGTSMASPHVAGTVALCIAEGPCAGLTPAQVIAKVVGDAQGYLSAHPASGFAGDPLHPDGDRYYGPLVRAGSY